jgi:hypothetical protein
MKGPSKNNVIHFTKVHYGKWVALSADRKKILDYSKDLAKLSKKNGKEAVYVRAQDPSLAHCF